MRKLAIILTLALLVIPVAAALELPPGLVKLAEHQQQLAASVTLLIALIAGILTFTSPCGFVVLPMFFTYVFKERKRAVLMTAAFALGMTLAFSILGLIAGASAAFLNEYKQPFAFVSGFVLVFFGILLFLNIGFSVFYFKLNHKQPESAWSSGLMGFFFAAGWTPCIGPVLAGILLVAANTGTAIKGAAMLATYSIGVAIPLLIMAALSDKYDLANAAWIRGKHFRFSILGRPVHTHTYNIMGAIILFIVGGIMIAQSGTFFFMNEIPKVLPWTMETFVRANEAVIASPFFTSAWANIIGLAIIALLAWAVFRWVRRKN